MTMSASSISVILTIATSLMADGGGPGTAIHHHERTVVSGGPVCCKATLWRCCYGQPATTLAGPNRDSEMREYEPELAEGAGRLRKL